MDEIKIYCHKCAFVAKCPSGGLPERCHLNKIVFPLAEIGEAVKASIESNERWVQTNYYSDYTAIDNEDLNNLLIWHRSLKPTNTNQGE